MKRSLISLLAVAISLLIIAMSGSAFAASKEDVSSSCVAPARGPILAMAGVSAAAQPQTTTTAAPQPLAKVGKPAPDFEANAFVNGGFKNIKLSDLKGQWVMLCFYPGDFTFV
jgi:AhpC/TSA family